MLIKRTLISTSLGAGFGVLAWIAARQVTEQPLGWLSGLTSIAALAAMGFAIGISTLPMRWWSHGVTLGFIFGLPLACAGMWARMRWAPMHVVVLAGGAAAGFAIELITSVLLKARAGVRVGGALREVAVVAALGVILVADGVYSFAAHRVRPRERITIGEYGDMGVVQHLARYNFAKALCVGKTVADIASGTGYGMKILREVAASVDGYDKEDLGGNFIIDLEKQSWGKHYDVIVSFETIEHLANPEFFLENAQRSADLLVLSTPLNEPKDRKLRNPFHKQAWTFPELKALLERFFQCEYCFQYKEAIATRVPVSQVVIAVCKPIGGQVGDLPHREAAP